MRKSCQWKQLTDRCRTRHSWAASQPASTISIKSSTCKWLLFFLIHSMWIAQYTYTCMDQLDQRILQHCYGTNKSSVLVHGSIFFYAYWTSVYLNSNRLLDGNALEGPIPTDLGKLVNLQVLWVWRMIYCDVSVAIWFIGSLLLCITVNEFFYFVFIDFTRNLSNNRLSGPIPESLANLPKLTELWENINNVLLVQSLLTFMVLCLISDVISSRTANRTRDLRNNNLSGEIPLALQQKASSGQLTFR